MTREQFDALLKRRDELEREHTLACEILEEEGPSQAHYNHRRCVRLYDQIATLQAQIDDAIAAEDAAESD